MKITSLIKLLLLAVMAVNIAGCIVIPGWDVDDWGHHHGEHHGEHHDRH